MEWLHPAQVTKSGTYVIRRTDDPDRDFNHNATLIKVERVHGYYADRIVDAATGQIIDTFDPECRFFGPIPPLP